MTPAHAKAHTKMWTRAHRVWETRRFLVLELRVLLDVGERRVQTQAETTS